MSLIPREIRERREDRDRERSRSPSPEEGTREEGTREVRMTDDRGRSEEGSDERRDDRRKRFRYEETSSDSELRKFQKGWRLKAPRTCRILTQAAHQSEYMGFAIPRSPLEIRMQGGWNWHVQGNGRCQTTAVSGEACKQRMGSMFQAWELLHEVPRYHHSLRRKRWCV